MLSSSDTSKCVISNSNKCKDGQGAPCTSNPGPRPTGGSREGFLPSRDCYLACFPISNKGAMPPRLTHREAGRTVAEETLKNTQVFLKLSTCLRGQRQLFPGVCICHRARHYSRGLKTLISSLFPARQLGLDRPRVSLTLPCTSRVSLSDSFNYVCLSSLTRRQPAVGVLTTGR